MDEQTPSAFLSRLWRLPSEPSRLGRRSTLDVDAVVRTAVELADAGGIAAATLPKVAEGLGVTAMSLYRHVGSKHDLLQLMADAASEPSAGHPCETLGPDSWHAGLHSWAIDLWELYRDRPWLLDVPARGMPSGPHQIAWLERGLAQLASTALDWDAKVMAVNLLNGHVRNSVLLTQQLAEGRPDDQAQAEREQQDALALATLIDADSYPQTAAMLTSEIFADAGESTEGTARRDFEAGLSLVLDGLAARISA